MAELHVLFPADPLDPRRVDEHYAREAEALQGFGVPYSLVDDDALAGDGAVTLKDAPPPGGQVLYRGWMLSSAAYGKLANELARRGLTPVTGALAYKTAHELPGWYETLLALTPRSVELDANTQEATGRAFEELGAKSAIVRDYTKSMKHHWDTACFIPDCSNPIAAFATITNFLALRDTELTGKVILRQFETFVSHEVRTWWMDGALTLVTPHPDTPDELPVDPDATDWLPTRLTDAIGRLDVRFVTVDLAINENGEWRVVELGDGQVSDLPSTTPAPNLYEALLNGL